jgi:redox-sensitive bicupin YhaK (pirin superfamily)
VTYVVEGRIDHYDNQGHEGTILPGDVQWMTAGRGLIHDEIPAEGVTVHSLQLWVNLPAADKMTGPRYQRILPRCCSRGATRCGGSGFPTIEPLSPSYCACG